MTGMNRENQDLENHAHMDPIDAADCEMVQQLDNPLQIGLKFNLLIMHLWEKPASSGPVDRIRKRIPRAEILNVERSRI